MKVGLGLPVALDGSSAISGKAALAKSQVSLPKKRAHFRKRRFSYFCNLYALSLSLSFSLSLSKVAKAFSI